MTWPDAIALVIGLTAALLITHPQRQGTTSTPSDPQDGERP